MESQPEKILPFTIYTLWLIYKISAIQEHLKTVLKKNPENRMLKYMYWR